MFIILIQLNLTKKVFKNMGGKNTRTLVVNLNHENLLMDPDMHQSIVSVHALSSDTFPNFGIL